MYGLPAVVAINKFVNDTDAEIELVTHKCQELGVNVRLSEVWEHGGDGGIELAKEVINLCENGENHFRFAYDLDQPIEKKIEDIATKVYGADGVDFTAQAKKDIATLNATGFDKMPVCMA